MTALLSLVLLFTFIAGCSGPATPGQKTEGRPAGPKAITISLEGEFNALATELDSSGVSGLSTYAHDFIHNYLTVHGDNDEVAAQLAAQLPSLDDGTWKLLPDGGMEVTWKLRHGVPWHDGTEFTSADVKFGWEVTVDPAAPLAVPGEAAARIYAMETPDPYTVVTHWRDPSRWAREFGRNVTNLLPRHLLEADFQANKAAFAQHPFFTSTDVVIGTGPFRPVEWARGSHLTVQAFDQYWAGKPKLDRVTFRFIKDNNTVMANLLAGQLDVANRGLNWDAVQLLRRDWVPQGKGELQVQPTNFRHNLFQFRPEVASPSDLTNPNVRRALIYGVNHEELVEGVFPGAGGHTVADSIGYPGTPIGDALEAAIVKYPYDARKASQLLEDAGWRRGDDGILVKNGERFRLDMQAGGDTEDDKTFLLMEPNYKAIGVELVYSSFGGRRQTPEDTAKFPGLQKTGLPYNQPTFGRRWDGRQIAAPENRYTGGNRSAYTSPAVDQALDSIDRSIRFDEELRWWADAWHHITNDAAVMGLFFVPNPIAQRTGMHGAFATNPSGTATWRAYTWDID
ncbi:MAG TPA: ABC transporter substrate-binding protein [Chloroflexota bacterium]